MTHASEPNAGETQAERQAPSGSLQWQSRVVLLLVAPAAAIYAALQLSGPASPRLALTSLLSSALFAVLVLAARAATPAGAALGALLALCYALTPSYPHSPLWPLLATLVLTLGASRIGRARKQAQAAQQGAAEHKHGRVAAQVAANLGVGALAALSLGHSGELLAHTALLAALAEAAADTLGSELGQLAPGPPRLLLTGTRVAPGTDGAVSPLGTAAGLGGALLVALVCRWAFALPWWAVGLGFAGAAFGFVLDTVLGQLLELRGWLNNDAVNFLSTLAAAGFALVVGSFF